MQANVFLFSLPKSGSETRIAKHKRVKHYDVERHSAFSAEGPLGRACETRNLTPKTLPTNQQDLFSAFLKHAFREVTCGFCKGTVPGAPPRPSPGPLRMPKSDSKEIGTTQGAPLGEEHVKWVAGCAEVPYQERPLPRTQGPKNAQRFLLKTVLGTRPESTFAPRHVFCWETLIFGNSLSSFQPFFVCKHELTEFLAELSEFALGCCK